MTNIHVSFLVPTAKKAAAIEACAHLTPAYGQMGFSRPVCPASPAPTYQTTPTHWRMSAVAEQAYAVAWQYVAVSGSLPAGYEHPAEATMTEQEVIDALDGATVTISNNIADTVTWAAEIMSALDPALVDVPPDPNI